MSTCDLSPAPVDQRRGSAWEQTQLPSTGRPPARKRSWTAGRLFAAVMLSGLLLRLVRLAMNGPLWGDEAMLVRSLLDRNYAELFQPLDYIQIAPLGFLWGKLTCFRWFGSAEWVWRLLPTIAGCLSLIGLMQFARQTLPKQAAWLAAAIAACSFYLVRHTVEVKPYIWDFAFAVALLQLGWRIHQRPEQWSRWLAFGVVAVIGVWCSFPSAFVAGGVLLSFVALTRLPLRGAADVRQSTHLLANWLLCAIALSASFLAMYHFFGRVQVKTANEGGYWQCSMWEVAYPPWQRPQELVWWLIREHAGSMMAHPFGGKNFASLGTLLLVISGAVTLARRNPRLLGLLLAPACLGFLAACLQKYPYGGTARTMLYLAPTICLLAGLGGWSLMVRFVSASKRRTFLSGALWCGLAMIAVKLGLAIVCPYKQYDDWVVRETVQRWAADSQPDDVWVVANAAATPERTDDGIYGGKSVAVFDHYTQIDRAHGTLYPRHEIGYPQTSGRVMLLVHESLDWPLTIEVGEKFANRFSDQATLLQDERVDLGEGSALRRLTFVAR